eukprot:jgi/Mesvir1/15837/Mv03387-RA.1
METSSPAPMVNTAQMKNFVGRRVTTVVQVDTSGGGYDGQGVATCKGPDGVSVRVKPKQGSAYNTQYIEVVGIVAPDGSLEEESFTCFGEHFDMANYNQLCLLAHSPECKHLFL